MQNDSLLLRELTAAMLVMICTPLIMTSFLLWENVCLYFFFPVPAVITLCWLEKALRRWTAAPSTAA